MPDELESDIQATAEDIAADADMLQTIEAEKAELDPADPRALDLATQAERLARDIASKTVAERELVVEAAEGPAPEPSAS
jgi:phage regulator Rha-like protein